VEFLCISSEPLHDQWRVRSLESVDSAMAMLTDVQRNKQIQRYTSSDRQEFFTEHAEGWCL